MELKLPSEEVEEKSGEGGNDENVGGYGLFSGKFSIVQSIPHCGEVHRARYSTHNPNLLLSRGPSSSLFIYDKTRHSSLPSGPPKPDLVLAGHIKEGYGMCWNHMNEGELITSSNDHCIQVYDINSTITVENHVAAGYTLANQKTIRPTTTFKTSSSIEDVQYHHNNKFLFAAGGEDKKVTLWVSQQHSFIHSYAFNSCSNIQNVCWIACNVICLFYFIY
jgi:histone-binding protein RBBP4